MPNKVKNTVAGIFGGFVVEASSALQMLKKSDSASIF